MSRRPWSPGRIQALGMVLIGALLGFAIASTWDRLAGPSAEEPPPSADAGAQPAGDRSAVE